MCEAQQGRRQRHRSAAPAARRDQRALGQTPLPVRASCHERPAIAVIEP